MIGVRGARRGTIVRPHVAQLATGVRARRGKVGYIGSQTALVTLNPGDSLPGGWNAHWDGVSLVVQGNTVTIDHYRINGSVTFSGNNPTMTNCKVYAQSGEIFGVTLSGAGKGVLTVTDTTVVGNSSSGQPQVNGISSDSGLVARRCDVSSTGDGIHMVAQASPSDAIVSQCYIHDLAFIDESQHCDGVQLFNNSSAQSFMTVEHCWIERTVSTIGTPMNSALTSGMPSSDTTPKATVTVNNNYFASGLYHLRLGYRLQNCVITNNDMGPVFSGEFGEVSVDVAWCIATWTANRNAAGATIANPYAPPPTPTIKQALQTNNGQTSAQTLSTSAGQTSAGDTLLIVYSTDNNTASAPTSTAGTLTQIGTDAVDGDSSGLLRAYTVPVTTSGSKDVVMPAAGGFDIMGAVFVLSGTVLADGFAKVNFPSSQTSFTTPAATLSGPSDLLVELLFNKQGRTFDITGTGLTQRANPANLPFASLMVATKALTSSGTSPTYAVTTNLACKPALVAFGLQVD